MIDKEHSFIPKEINSAFKRQAWYTSVAYTTYFLFGIMRGYPAFLLDQLKSESSTIPVQSDDQSSWIASLSIFPNPIGSILAGIIMDKFGRKITLQLSMFIFTVGWTFITCSRTLWMLYIGNIIVGLAIGMGACSTIYVAEICEIRNRAMMLSFLEIFYSLGFLVAYVFTYYLGWNMSALIFTVFSALSLLLLYYIPESPYWLMKVNRLGDALKSYKKLNGNQTTTQYDIEFNNIVLSLDEEKQTKGMNVLLHNLKAFAILVTFHLLLQGCGYTILVTYVNYYIPYIALPVQPEQIALGFSFSSFLTSFVTPLTVNYYRRREATIISGIGMTMALSLLTFHNVYIHTCTLKYFWLLVPIGLYSFMFFCTIGILTLTQAMIGELYPTDVRGMMCGVTEAVGTILSGLTVKLHPFIASHFKQSTILAFFAFASILTALFGKFILPETHGKSLNEIQEQYFRKGDLKKSNKKPQIERQA